MLKFFIFLLLLPSLSWSQNHQDYLLDNYMNGQEMIKSFSGTVLVAQNDRIIYEKAFGIADMELSVKNNTQGKFLIGSITKQFTACGILILVEEGKLRLNDKLNKFISDFPKGDSVTIHMLLTHTSGLINSGELNGFNEKLPYSNDSMIVLIKRHYPNPYAFSPGSNWKYSNCGYWLLGYIIEKVTNRTYEDFIDDVIKKAGLLHTSVNRWDTILPNRVRGYEKTATGWRNALYLSMEGKASAGYMISTKHYRKIELM